jgi:putative ABC transport system permease protein
VVGRLGIQAVTSLNVDIEPRWIAISAAMGLVSGALGALYPALRAAYQDPVKALSYD